MALPLTALLLFLSLTPEETRQGFVPLFDGQTLAGWQGDPRLWRVQDGMIVGSTEGVKIERNSFLTRDGDWGDFTLRVSVKLRNHNSGIQFRSESLPGYVVRGYQADLAEGNWWGGVYEEGGKRGVLVNGWKDKAEKVVKPGDWNDLEVTCRGELTQIRVNGLLTAELRDKVRSRGILALQLHAGPAMEVIFRDLRIKPL